MADYWQKEWQKAENKKVKNDFTIGYLTAALRDHGATAEQVAKYLEDARAEADRVYGTV